MPKAFAGEDIDFAILIDLTDQDLEKIGVKSLGHRRRMLGALAELVGGSKVTIPTSVLTTSGVMPRDAAERRQVAVMLSDLVGSTALSARMDPEDLRDIISACQECAAEPTLRHLRYVLSRARTYACNIL